MSIIKKNLNINTMNVKLNYNNMKLNSIKNHNKMRTSTFILLFAGFLNVKSTLGQFTFSDVKYWIGSGPDSSVLVVDFKDGTWDSCYAWGFLHDPGTTAETMLNAIASADINFSVNISSGFLMDIQYGNHEGIGGSPNYWGTWSGSDLNNLTMNMGISTLLSNGDFFACSYTDFNPPLVPGTPIPAFDPFYFTRADVQFWVGTGPDSTILVIDFLDGSGLSSFAWGYLHNGPVTGEQILNDVSAADSNLNVNISGGFLMDITYGTYSGLGGNPNYWGTWSASNLGNWDLNMGISTLVIGNDLFGCSYTNFLPPLRPEYPKPAPTPSSSFPVEHNSDFLIFPNPTADYFVIRHNQNNNSTGGKIKIIIRDNQSRIVKQFFQATWAGSIDVTDLNTGVYTIQIENSKGIFIHKLLIAR